MDPRTLEPSNPSSSFFKSLNNFPYTGLAPIFLFFSCSRPSTSARHVLQQQLPFGSTNLRICLTHTILHSKCLCSINAITANRDIGPRINAHKQTKIDSQARSSSGSRGVLVEMNSGSLILRGPSHCYYIISSNLACDLPNRMGSDLVL